MTPADLWAKRTLRRFRRLLYVLGTLLVLAEGVALTGWVPALRPLSLGEITSNLLYALGFGIPLLLYLCSRPRWPNLLRTGLAGLVLALLVWPLQPAADSDWVTPEGTVVAKLVTGLGLASLGALAATAWRGSGRQRTVALLHLMPACVALDFTFVAGIFTFFISSIFPQTYDSFACACDMAYGTEPSFAIGRLFRLAPPLGALCHAVYLTPAVIFIYALEIRLPRPPAVDVLTMTLLLMFAGYGLYFLYPVCGPRPAFGDAFPATPPALDVLLAGTIPVGFAPRNGVPSLHMAGAILAYWHARPCGRWARLGAGIYVIGTFLATMGLGEHYFVDLVIALPFTLALCSMTASVGTELRSTRWTAIAVGVALVGVWYLLLFRPTLLLGSPILTWSVTLITVAVVLFFDRRLFWAQATRRNDDPAPALWTPPAADRKEAPGPRGHLLIGNLVAFRRDVLGMLLQARQQHGDLIRVRLGPMLVHVACHPELIRQVLVTHQHNYTKATRSSAMIRGITGRGLLVSNGDEWLTQRRLMQPIFQHLRLARFLDVMTGATEQMLKRWQTLAESGQPFDVASEMMRLTFTVVGRTLFGADLERDGTAVERAAGVVMRHTYRRLELMFDWPLELPTPGNLRFRRAMRYLDSVVARVLQTSGKDGAPATDLLSLLAQQRDEETGAGMSGEQARNETITLLLAGHETTANALTWTWYLLSTHPEAAHRVRDEVQQVLGDRPLQFDDLARLSYTTAVIQESMRLYPPIWIMERRVVEDDTLAGYHIPAGSTVALSPYVTHRHPDFWPDPERFDPERFSAEQSARRAPYAYIPFGGGQRLCIGSHFAMMEAQVIVALVARAYHLDLVPNFPVEPLPGITLRARHGLQMVARLPSRDQ